METETEIETYCLDRTTLLGTGHLDIGDRDGDRDILFGQNHSLGYWTSGHWGVREVETDCLELTTLILGTGHLDTGE